jgi:pSer/pThr/pTyr-binding forkhead associated (FHA) protein
MDVRLVVEKGAKKKREIRLKSEDTIIGRRTGCDLRVPSASVSRRHCRLSFRDDCLVVEDLQSANGTYVNGIRVTDSQVVNPGDRLEVGPVTFLVQYKGPAGQAQGDIPEMDVEELVPVFDADEIEVAEGEENKNKKRKKTVAEPKTGKKEPESAKEKKPAKKPPAQEAEEELPLALDESSWHMPAGEDIRDILSQMEDS